MSGRVSKERPQRPLTRDDILRASDVAELLHCPKSTVEDWARRGVIPSRKIGRRRVFLRFEIERWLIDGDQDLDLVA